jgi:rhodanese-related sulfurtransferase
MFGIKEIEIFDLQKMLSEEGKSLKLVDVRSPAEVMQGTIPGAEHIPLHLLPMHAQDIPDDPMVVFYCRSGARSAQACNFLNAQGKDNVYNLRGGIMAWMQGGLDVA